MRNRQGGAYLLEALIGLLIFSLGILGIVGLQAASLRATSDAGLRAEAVFAANQLIGQMWADNIQNLDGNYSQAIAGPKYTAFRDALKAAQGAAWYQDPAVVFDPAGIPPPSTTGRWVMITVWWKTCASINCNVLAVDKVDVHNYTTTGVVGQNAQ
jgi:type IV pilus assembly protein PilV